MSSDSPLFVAQLARVDMTTSTTSGEFPSLEWRQFLEQDGQRASWLHDVPLRVADADGVFNFVCEIPKGTNGKLEISPKEQYNPIKQDVKNGKLRNVADLDGHKGYPWNYGAFPQTWENPCHKDAETQAYGDNDPLDVCEIGGAAGKTGEVMRVKVLGVLAMIDDGETDWKIIAISLADPDAERINDVDDIDKVKPGYTKMLYEWLRDYKIPDGKPANQFAFDGKALDRAKALRVIDENHAAYNDLVAGKIAREGTKGNGKEQYSIWLKPTATAATAEKKDE